MAIFGGIGKSLGLGTTASIVERATGSRIAGAIAGEVSEGISNLGKSVTSNIGQGTAVASPGTPPAETAMSGERGPVSRMQTGANLYGGSFQPASFRGVAPQVPGGVGVTQTNLPAIVGGGAALTRSIGGMLGLAGGALMVAPIIIDPFTGEEKKLRVTRRLKSQVKKAVEMFGVELVADQMGVDVEVIFYILTKRMRNDGPYVTKAAVRKTRQTVRKMKNLCDMYDDLRPAAKRRAPTRAASRTRVVNVK